MKNFFKKITHNFDKKTLLTIFILAIADLFVFSGVLYLRYVIPNFNTYLGLSQGEFDLIVSVYGFVSLFTRIPGGWLADRFSAKKMLIFSLVGTGIIGLWWTITIQLKDTMTRESRIIQLYIIYTLWGITIAGLFWTPLWKLLSQNVKKEDQGAAYGLEGSFVGLFGLLLVTGGGILVTFLVKNGHTWAFFAFAYAIMGFVFLSALLASLFIKKIIREQVKKIHWKEKIKDIFQPMKFLRVWLMGIFVFGMYMFQSTFAYYMKDVLSRIGVTAVLVTAIGGLRSYGLRFVVSSPVGKWSDRWKSYVFGLVALLAIGLMMAIFYTSLPGFNGWFVNLTHPWQIIIQIVMVILFIVIGCIGWALLTLRFVQVGEIAMPKNSYANTIAVISWIAFTPDAWFGYIASVIGKNFSESVPGHPELTQYSLTGLQILLGIAIGCVVCGLIAGWAIFQINKREIKKLGKTSYRWRDLGNI